MTVINSGNPFALTAYPQVNGNYPTLAPSGMMGRGQPWPEDRLQPTFQASPGAIANAGGGMPPQQPAGSPGSQNPYALTAYSPQGSSNPAVNAISGSMSATPPTASYTQGMSPSSGGGGLLSLLTGGSKNGMGGLLGMLGGPQQGGLLQMLLGNRGQQGNAGKTAFGMIPGMGATRQPGHLTPGFIPRAGTPAASAGAGPNAMLPSSMNNDRWNTGYANGSTATKEGAGGNPSWW